MRRVLIVCLCLLLMPAAANAAGTILVLGDSLSAGFGIDTREGWVTLLERRLARERHDYKVVNASISGDVTASGAARLPRLLDLHKPAIVIVELGGNDGLRGLPIEAMKRNLGRMIRSARDAGAKVLLIGVEIPPNYGPAYTEKFRSAYRESARELQTPLVPSILEGIGANPTLMQPDRIHPTAEAQAKMLENVFPALRKLL